MVFTLLIKHFSLRDDTNLPTQPQVVSLDLSTTSLNETDNRTLTVTVVTKGFQQSLRAVIVPVGGSNVTADDFSTPSGSNMYVNFTSSPRILSKQTFLLVVAEDETDETPDTEQFQIEIRDLDNNVYATSSTVSINDTSTVTFLLFTNKFLPYL